MIALLLSNLGAKFANRKISACMRLFTASVLNSYTRVVRDRIFVTNFTSNA